MWVGWEEREGRAALRGAAGSGRGLRERLRWTGVRVGPPLSGPLRVEGLDEGVRVSGWWLGERGECAGC